MRLLAILSFLTPLPMQLDQVGTNSILARFSMTAPKLVNEIASTSDVVSNAVHVHACIPKFVDQSRPIDIGVWWVEFDHLDPAAICDSW